MLRGLGCDVVEVSRIERAMQNPRFLARVFTERERAAIGRKGPVTAAGYWAAKEAVSKALGTGFVGYALQDIEIRPDETIVLAQTMEWPEEIEINRVREAMERAEEELRQQQSLREYQLSKATMARCFARLRLRSHYDNDQL